MKTMKVGLASAFVLCILFGSLVQIAAGREVIEARQETGRILVGLGSAEISPPQDQVEAFGWGKVSSPLYVKVMILRVNKLSVAWVTYDAIAIPSPGPFRDAVVEATGIPPERVMIAATHTHGDPPLVPAVTAWMVEKTVEAATQASKGMFPARVGVSHRELPADMNENRNVDVSPPNTDLFVMRIDDLSGNLRGIVFNYPSHPTLFSYSARKGEKLDADYPGRVRDRLVRWYAAAGAGDRREELWSMFSLGPAAHYQPWDYRSSDPLDTLEWFVESLAWHVLDLARRTQTRAQVQIGFIDYLNYLQALTLDDAVLLSVPGELSEELAVRVRQELGSDFRHVIFGTVTNGYEGYFVSGPEEIEQVTYEAKMDSPSPGEKMMDDLVRLFKPDYAGRDEAEWTRQVGEISGRIIYEPTGSLTVGVMNHAEHPIEDWKFNGKKVVTRNSYELTNMAPGMKYLYILELIPRDGGVERKVLTYGRPVFVRPGEHVVADFDFSGAVWETAVQGLKFDEASIETRDGDLDGKVVITGRASDGEIVGLVHPWEGSMILDSGRNSLPEPLRSFSVSRQGEFRVSSLPSGTYGLVVMVDLNGNNRPEPVVDVVSPVSKPVVVR